jgi:hypothetical protein
MTIDAFRKAAHALDGVQDPCIAFGMLKAAAHDFITQQDAERGLFCALARSTRCYAHSSETPNREESRRLKWGKR